MKIRELLEDSSSSDLTLKLSAVLGQIAGSVIDSGSETPVSLTSLLSMLNDLGIDISEDQFRDMVTQDPLKNTIANISGDDVTFIGQRKDTSASIKPDQTTATLEKMAKRAEKKRS